MGRRRQAGRSWARARDALDQAFRSALPGAREVEIGYVEFVDRGGSREVFGTDVTCRPGGETKICVALLPLRDVDPDYPERARGEASALEHLKQPSARPRRVRVPEIIGLVEGADGPALVETFVTGVSVDLRAGRMPICPWELVAELASEVHAITPPDALLRRSRQQHRRDALRELAASAGAIGALADARAWMSEWCGQASDETPGALLHGDLRGQNIRLHPGEPYGLIDWEHVGVGDPAYDLSIVTRGARRPFQTNGGLARLLEAYNQRARVPVSRESVRFFELALLHRLLHRARARGERGDEHLRQIKRILGELPKRR